MIALDRQHVRAQRRHPLHHSWLLEGVLSGFNHGWCAAHNGTITMKAVTAMSKQQLTEEYENICRRVKNDRDTSPPSDVPAASTHHADDPDSAGGGSFNPAGTATPMTGSAVPSILAVVHLVLGIRFYGSQLRTMDSPASHRELGISPFADSDESSSPSVPSDATELDSDDEVPAEILYRGSRYKHRGWRSDTSLWDRPVDDFLSSESESDDDIEEYIPPIPYGAFKDWEIVLFGSIPDVDVGLDLWRDVNLLCQSLILSCEDFWRTQDEWVFYPIRAPLLERMLRHRLTVPPSYCRDVVVAGSVIQTIQDGLRESYECLASAPMVLANNPMDFNTTMFWNKEWLVQEGTALVPSSHDDFLLNTAAALTLFPAALTNVSSLQEDLSKKLGINGSTTKIGEDCWTNYKRLKCPFLLLDIFVSADSTKIVPVQTV
ncbi:hypothetical protein Tco_0967126 [Tanacetum coccineum]